MPPEIALFALGSSHGFGAQLAGALGVALSPLEERDFEDGEFKLRPLAGVRGGDVYAISSLNGAAEASGADKLLRLLMFIGALKDSGAARVTAVTPYLGFSRKDRRTKPRDPISTRYIAQLFEAMRTDRVMAIDAHNIAAFENAFRCETVPLDAHALFARRLAPLVGEAPVAVVSPDLGGEKRAELFRQRMERALQRPVAKAFLDKVRSEGRVTGDIFAGDVSGRIAIILDDLVAGGGTVARAATACRAHGATAVLVAATHAVFAKGAAATLRDAAVDRIFVTDSVPLSAKDETVAALQERLTIVSVAPLFAEAIRRLHEGGSIAQLLEDGA
ncbi:ribose-phosphate diphosphokinase [Methylocystis parvus]|uniref:ribose-phosphate diphosphokinase n=1 Tax=Methylocystis parvus TaxID=134 RepID=A0A6B8M4I8_9HYPH|nr:ribose-phosphate diphosphokinase [Methylocystis parvus]QGM96679.1 ribose-phosphate pyrophosphokinase [Methylocystis parvus]WBJ99455.1 ribose-phosphate diphosphokinase [Methylocystis parvus OBBP]